MIHVEFVGGPVDGEQVHLLGEPRTYTVPVKVNCKVRYHIYERTDTVTNGVVLFKWKGYNDRKNRP
jgi:hypothetical protein